MSRQKDREIIDKMLAFSLIHNLLKPFTQMDAYRLGLIDSRGEILKEAKTDQERLALSIYNVTIIELKKLLGSRLNFLNKMLFVSRYNEKDIMDKLLLSTTSIEQKSSIVRLDRVVEEVFMSGIEKEKDKADSIDKEI